MNSARTAITGKAGQEEKGLLPQRGNVLESVRSSLDHIGELVDSTKHAMMEFIQEQKMASMEKLASGIAHDINSCLVILGTEIHLINKTCRDSEILNRLARMQKVLDDLESLVRHISLIGSDEMAVELLPRDLSVEVKRVVDAISSSVRGDVTLHVSTSSVPLPVLLCQGDVWRILNNLIVNAQEAMSNGGDLLIGTYLKQVDGEYCRKHGNARKGMFAVLAVEDHGTGIPQEMLEQIFDPLFTTKSQDQAKGKHGWGLAVVYALVKRRRGWIDVNSRMGEGTRFEVFLPLCIDEREEQAKDGRNA